MDCFKALVLVVSMVVGFMNVVEARDSDICHNIQIVYLLDTSGSNEESGIEKMEYICDKFDTINYCYKQLGFNVQWDMYSINYNAFCATKSVYESFSNHDISPVKDCEDWGEAVIVLAQQYDWLPNYQRSIVIITDEPASCGLPYNEDDYNIMLEMLNICEKERIVLSAIQMPLGDSKGYSTWFSVNFSKATHGAIILVYRDNATYMFLNEYYDPINKKYDSLCRLFQKGVTVGLEAKITGICKDGDCTTLSGKLTSRYPAVSYHWTPEQYFDNPFTANPTVCPPGPMMVYVEVVDSLGCVGRDSVKIDYERLQFEYNDVRICKPGEKVKMSFKKPLPERK